MIPIEMSDRDSVCSQEEEVDPRIQGELESLNGASSEINTLEREVDKSRNKFRYLLSESTQKLNVLFKKLGKVVMKARPYYDLLEESKRAQTEAQRAAVNFQRANSIYKTAKETVSLAEEKVVTVEGDKWEFDSAWQEMLNHATIKFMESEVEKAKSEQEHLMKAAEYAAISSKLKFYEKDMPRSINKARPYFEMKDKLQHKLQMERQNVEDLQRALLCSKFKYKTALSNLEIISEEIHLKRKRSLQLPPRTPGVGAESISDLSDLPSIKLDNLSDTCSFLSCDDLEADGASLRDVDPAEYERRYYLPPPSVQSEIDLDLGALELTEKVKAVDMRNDFMPQRMAPIGKRDSEGGKEKSKEDKAPLATNQPTNVVGADTLAVTAATSDDSNKVIVKDMEDEVALSPFPHKNADSTQGLISLAERQREEAAAERKQRKQEKRLQTQQAFPMLAGLSQLQQKQTLQNQISRVNITLKTQAPVPSVVPSTGRSVVQLRHSVGSRSEPQGAPNIGRMENVKGS